MREGVAESGGEAGRAGVFGKRSENLVKSILQSEWIHGYCAVEGVRAAQNANGRRDGLCERIGVFRCP